MTSSSVEKIVLKNPFGCVTSRRVTYSNFNGLFGGRRREDIPINQIASVRYETERRLLLGLFMITLGFAILQNFPLLGMFTLSGGAIFVWGFPVVIVLTTGGRSISVSGFPWQKKSAEDFAEALRSQLFREDY